MKIHYTGNFLGGVAEKYDGPNVQVVQMLRKLGYEVSFAGTSSNQFRRLAQVVISILRARIRGIDLIIIDCFSTKAFYFSIVASQLSMFLRLKYALVLHGGNLPERFKKSDKLSSRLLKGAVFVASPSGYLAQAAKRAFQVEVDIIPNRIRVDENWVADDQRGNALFWVRSLDAIYNPEMAIEVMRELNKRGLNLQLYLIGPGDPHRTRCINNLIEDYNLNGSVRVMGRMDRSSWHRLAKKGRYFINTTTVDNTPSSVIEAMTLGLLPISTNVGGIPFILDHGINSILVDSNDYMGMSKTIIDLENNPDGRRVLLENGRSKIQATYHEGAIVKAWERALEVLHR